MMKTLALFAAVIGFVAFGDEYDQPVRPIGVDGQPAWNVAATQFTYAPTFGFEPVAGAVRYRFEVVGGDVRQLFEADRATAPLTPVWAKIPVGDVSVSVVGLAADGKELGTAQTRKFWKMPPFREGTYPKAIRSYGETASLIWRYIFNRPYLQYMLDKGEPDPSYPLNSYPSKMLASQIWAMLRYAKMSPADAPRAMKVAKAAADRLIARAQPKGSPLEYFPPTYDGRGEAGNNYVGEKFKGMHMLHYPAAAGEALLDYAAASGESSYRAFACKIADTYVRLQGEDGTWWLKMDQRTGKPVCENRLVPIRVLTFLERVAKVTGDEKYGAAAERAFGFIEKGPLTDWNWEGQFEDIYPAPLYANLTKHGACDVAIYLLRRFPGDRRRLAQARELLRWSEDQFVVWDGRYNRKNIKQWTTPVALEQYHCYQPIDESAAKMVMTYLELYRAERDPRDLAKARAIGDAFTRVTLEDGRLRTYWNTDSRTNEHEDWVNGQVVSALALEDLARTCSPAQTEELSLAGTWRLTQADKREVSCPVAVPGGIYTALYEAKLIPDPFFAQNEKKTQWPSRVEWDFEREFDASEALAGKKSVTLRLEDVDCFADIYLNGTKVGETSNRFRRWDFDVKGVLKPGRNTIRGRFHSTENISYAESDKYPKNRFHICNATVKQINLVRTVQCHGGWDWGITQMDTGFMGAIKLIAVDDVRLDYVYTVQKFAPDYSKVDVEVTAEAYAPVAGKVDFKVRLGEVEKSVRVALNEGENKVSTTVTVERPRLWWPNEAGEQPLYDFTVTLGTCVRTRKLGLRKVEIINDMDKAPDPVDGKKGRQMTVSVNGKRIFMKGADWIPCDAFENRQVGRYRQHLEDAKLSHMNMVRVWGGGQFEHPEFYELCDELGIMIWHDFMFSCATYPGTKEFLANVAEEVRHQVKNLRDYASIALWCGDNECIGAAGWFDSHDSENYRDNIRLCAERAKFLDAICRVADPTRTFWPSSPCLGPGNFGDGWKDDSSGDMHFWGVWFGGALFTRYHEVRPRFCSEFGYQSYPSLETSLTYVSPDQLNPWAPDFFYHQKSPNGNKYIIETMMKYFRFPKNVKSVHFLSQVQQALAIKTGVEHFRHIMPRCMGSIYWQLCDNWPVASWSSIEYGGKWKHLQYHAKRFYAPCALTVKPAYKDDNTLEFWVMNDKDEPLKGDANLACWSFGGKVEKSLDYTLDVPPRSAKLIASLPIADFGDAEQRKGRFLAMSGTECPDNECFFNFYRECDFAEAKVDFAAEEKDGEWRVTLKTDKPAFYVWADVPGIRGVFSDDSFTLLPVRPRTLTFTKRASEKATFADFRKALEVMHLRETY